MDNDVIFTSYLRLLLRQLKRLDEYVKNKEYEKAETILSQLIQDTQSDIEN